ncbi:hypothetical protein [Aeromonas jandaei]|uniref:hypothetical protein n=1 Tax=Aeromonas jandaei TaxID=650 RepID=UPI003EC6E822
MRFASYKKNTFVFIVQQKGGLILAKKNTIMDDETELASFYHKSKSMGWEIVADRVCAKNAHSATLKVHFLHDSHRIMLLACIVNFLLLFVVTNIIINVLIACACLAGYVYAVWTLYHSQSPMLQELSAKH